MSDNKYSQGEHVDAAMALMKMLFGISDEGGAFSAASVYDTTLSNAVGATRANVFQIRDMMKAGRSMDEAMEQDALDTGMTLYKIACNMFLNEQYEDAFIRFVRSAVRYDIESAQWVIAMCLHAGVYFEKDTDEAKRWFDSAAEKQHDLAIGYRERYYVKGEASNPEEIKVLLSGLLIVDAMM